VQVCQIFRTQQQEEWLEVLSRVARHDVYHLPHYHRVEERQFKAAGHLFVYGEGDYLIALPLLLSPVEILPEWNDATSVYGYAGPVASHKKVPEPIVRNFHAALAEALLERRVISVFSRLHPLISQYVLLSGLGECRTIGRTISIDLTLSPEQQRAQYRRTVKSAVNRQQRKGKVTCLHDPQKRYLRDFISIYEETMRRVGAADSYYFGENYFGALVRELGPMLQLFIALIDGRPAAGLLVTICNSIVQYYLGGTRSAFLKFSPSTPLFDTVRLWANEAGAHAFHLGGGVGAKQDSLFHYKAGFSDCRLEFAIWRWVVAPEIYRELCDRWSRKNQLQALEPDTADYFPTYRCPTTARVPISPKL
jgi:hypothetical protein